jgi:hypothetical protein
MMEVTTALSIFDKLLDLLGLVKAGKIKRNEQVDLAFHKTHKALIETEVYIQNTTAQGRKRQKETELAELWYEASIPMRHVDKKLAKIFNLKGGYWSNPDSWDDMRSGDADISLKNVQNLYSELFSKNRT